MCLDGFSEWLYADKDKWCRKKEKTIRKIMPPGWPAGPWKEPVLALEEMNGAYFSRERVMVRSCDCVCGSYEANRC